MTHDPGLIQTVAYALGFAALGGFAAARLGLPPIVGYLLAGIALGPFTPGFVADPEVAGQLAEIGVALLMFGVGIQFSMRDLLAVRAVAVPAALVQIAIITGLTAAAATLVGWPLPAGLVLGLAVSMASTVVLLRALVERGELESPHGRIAVGWLIVEDIFVVLVLVALPSIAGALGAGGAGAAGWDQVVLALLIAAGKVLALGALMVFVGARLLPWVLVQVARTGARELFTLAVLALALGIAVGAAGAFGVSLALGAFLAGAVVSESDLSHRIAADALPLRDAFAVLFFVSVGLLFDPAFVLSAAAGVIGILALIVLGKGLAAAAIMLAFAYPLRSALRVAVGRAQIGEFSFILSAVGRELGLLPAAAHDLILAGALISITLNPLLFRAVDPVERWLGARPWARRLGVARAGSLARLEDPDTEGMRRHAILCGHGRVGSVIADALRRRGFNVLVIEEDRRVAERLRRDGIPALYGDAASPLILERAGLREARLLIVAIPDAPAARRIVEEARATRPDLEVIVRTHSEEEWRYLRTGPSSSAVWGERELAVEMASQALRRFGVSSAEILNITQGLRRR